MKRYSLFPSKRNEEGESENGIKREEVRSAKEGTYFGD